MNFDNMLTTLLYIKSSPTKNSLKFVLQDYILLLILLSFLYLKISHLIIFKLKFFNFVNNFFIIS